MLFRSLRSRFPATERVVGEEFFIAMAQIYIRANPPTSPVMFRFGDSLPAFIEQFAPAGEVPYLADVSRIEASRTRAYHAADATPLEANAFADLDPERLMGLRLQLDHSVEIIRSAHPAFTIWAMNSDELPLHGIQHWQAEDAAVARPGFEVEVRKLPAGGAAFMLALLQQQPLGAAANLALADNSGFDLTANLAGLIGARMINCIF